MDEETLSTPNDLDDNIVDDDQTGLNEESQVETEESTTEESEYDKAWKSLNNDEIPDEIFGETTVQETTEQPSEESQPKDVVDEQVDQGQGLVIKNPILRHNGRDIPIEGEEELLRLAQQGLDYNIKSSKVKKAKPFVPLVEQGLTVELAKAVVDLVNGNQGALDYIKQQAGIKDESNDSIFSMEETTPSDEGYKPEVQNEDPVMEYFSDISSNYPEVGAKVTSIYGEIDDTFKAEIYNPQTFPAFVQSVATGEFEKVYPYAIKARAVNPALSWLEAYKLSGQRINSRTPLEQEAVQPPNGTRSQKSNKTKREVKSMNYDTAFDMDMGELESKLFSD